MADLPIGFNQYIGLQLSNYAMKSIDFCFVVIGSRLYKSFYFIIVNQSRRLIHKMIDENKMMK